MQPLTYYDGKLDPNPVVWSIKLVVFVVRLEGQSKFNGSSSSFLYVEYVDK